MKSIFFKKTESRRIGFLPFSVLLGMLCVATSCSKDDIEGSTINGIQVSETESFEAKAGPIVWKAEGGLDTLYVTSNSPLRIAFETNEINDWVKVDRIESIPGTNKSRVILDVLPMDKTFKKRIGVLNLNNDSPFSGAFIRLNQGYDTRIEENFTWLKFGLGSPLDLSKSSVMSKWSTAQKQVGWTSLDTETVLGMNGYLMLGTPEKSGELSSAIFPGLEKDSLLLLTFDAIGYVDANGNKDNSKLSIKLVGAEFENGESSRVIDLNHYDYQSALLLSNMWDNARFSFVLKKPKLNPTSSTIQLQFSTKDVPNRLFLDNINLYITDRFTDTKKK